MAVSRFLVVVIGPWLALVGVLAGSEAETSSPMEEIQQLRLRISSLEFSVSEQSNELKRKAEIIQQLENIVEEESATTDSLQREMKSLQKRGAINAQRTLGKAYACARELEKQIDGLVNELKSQSKKRKDLEARASRAEYEMGGLCLKLERLETRNADQRHRLQEIQHALKILQEELAKTQLEAKLTSSKLVEVHQAWLPFWLAKHLSLFQNGVTIYWNKYRKPSIILGLQKASHRLTGIQKQMEPYFTRVQMNWIHALKEHCKKFTRHIGLLVQCLTNKLARVYTRCQAIIVLHIVKLQELLDPYYKRAKKFWQSNITWICSNMKLPEKVHSCRRQVVHAYQNFFDSVTVYHLQIQSLIQDTLERHEASKRLANKEFLWLLATALLASPAFFMYRLFSAFFGKFRRSRRCQRVRMGEASGRQKSKHATEASRVC
ncbi:uncharacterized protein LOC141822662 [Curcuma longa]|uniref:uncharacterized protein LOC141822662 n=1 Tax=Curcuma longa TaxID=136217 RepID=UPI003D9F5AA7